MRRVTNLFFILGLAISYYFGYLRGAGVITEEQLRALLVMIATFLMIATEYRHKVVASLAGVVALWALGILSGWEMFLFLDMEVLGLLFGMMIVVGSLKVSGFFELLSDSFLRLRMGPVKLMVTLTSVTAFLSAFLDNITVALFMVTVAINLSRSLGISSVPLTVGTAFSAVIGGLGTLVGDPPNIMIASATGATFTEFLLNTGPAAVVAYLVCLGTTYLYYRDEFREAEVQQGLSGKRPKVDRFLMYIGLSGFLGAVILFLLQDLTGIPPAAAAIYAATFVIALGGRKTDKILKEIEWDILIFLGALLVIAGGLEKTGLLHLMAEGLLGLVGHDVELMMSIILWLSALLSSVVDNIPVTASLIPMLKEITEELNANHLWWALASGAAVGGLATPLASVPVLVAYKSLEEMGEVRFVDLVKVGMLFLLVVTAALNAYLLLRY